MMNAQSPRNWRDINPMLSTYGQTFEHLYQPLLAAEKKDAKRVMDDYSSINHAPYIVEYHMGLAETISTPVGPVARSTFFGPLSNAYALSPILEPIEVAIVTYIDGRKAQEQIEHYEQMDVDEEFGYSTFVLWEA